VSAARPVPAAATSKGRKPADDEDDEEEEDDDDDDDAPPGKGVRAVTADMQKTSMASGRGGSAAGTRGGRAPAATGRGGAAAPEEDDEDDEDEDEEDRSKGKGVSGLIEVHNPNAAPARATGGKAGAAAADAPRELSRRERCVRVCGGAFAAWPF
jgi:hypothetical protein